MTSLDWSSNSRFLVLGDRGLNLTVFKADDFSEVCKRKTGFSGDQNWIKYVKIAKDLRFVAVSAFYS